MGNFSVFREALDKQVDDLESSRSLSQSEKTDEELIVLSDHDSQGQKMKSVQKSEAQITISFFLNECEIRVNNFIVQISLMTPILRGEYNRGVLFSMCVNHFWTIKRILKEPPVQTMER